MEKKTNKKSNYQTPSIDVLVMENEEGLLQSQTGPESTPSRLNSMNEENGGWS